MSKEYNASIGTQTKAKDLVQGDMIDLGQYWAVGEVDINLSTYAQYEYGIVENVVPIPGGQVVVYLSDAPSNIVCPSDYEFMVMFA